MTETLYAGMAGDTDEGRFVSAGLYRRAGDSVWERIDQPFDAPPEVRAILTDPRRPERVLIAGERGIFLSDDAAGAGGGFLRRRPDWRPGRSRAIRATPTSSSPATSRPRFIVARTTAKSGRESSCRRPIPQ